MERDTKRGKKAALLNKKLENAIRSNDWVEVDDLLESGIDPNLLNEQNETVFDIFFESPSIYHNQMSRIFESLLKAGAKFDTTYTKDLLYNMMLPAIKYADSVEYIEELLKQTDLHRFNSINLAQIIKLAHKKGVDMLKNIGVFPERVEYEGDFGTEGSLYKLLLNKKTAYEKQGLNTRDVDELINIARQEEVRRALSGTLQEPLQEGLVTRDTLPDDIIEKISRISKGGKKKRKSIPVQRTYKHRVSTKRKLIKRKKRKSLFKKKSYKKYK